MSQPISNKALFIGVGALDSPKMDDCSDENTSEKKGNRESDVG
jgi:hypothetical protein